MYPKFHYPNEYEIECPSLGYLYLNKHKLHSVLYTHFIYFYFFLADSQCPIELMPSRKWTGSITFTDLSSPGSITFKMEYTTSLLHALQPQQLSLCSPFKFRFKSHTVAHRILGKVSQILQKQKEKQPPMLIVVKVLSFHSSDARCHGCKYLEGFIMGK